MKMPSRKIVGLTFTIMLSSMVDSRVNAQAIDMAATAQIDTGIALESGLAVPTGSWMAFGYYPTALTGPLTDSTQMSDILNPGGANAFVTLFTGTMGLDDGAGGFYEGLFAAGIQSTDATPVGQQLYYIIGNNPVSLSLATEVGVFTSPSWVIPSLGEPVPTLFATDISEVPRDSTGILFGSQGIGTSVAGIAGADPALPNYNLKALTPPDTYLSPGTYHVPEGEKVKLGGVEAVPGATYQWLKGGLPVRLARTNQLDLTPGTATFGPAQTGVYQLQQRQGTNVINFGPWVITHDDPTILVYNLVLKGTATSSPEDPQTQGASEAPVTLGGFLLLDRSADDGDTNTVDLEAVLVLTRTDRIGKKIVGRSYWVERRYDADVQSNGPLAGTAKIRPSRTLLVGLRGAQSEQLAEGPLWLAGDRDVLWLSGNDALLKLDKTKTPKLIVAPATMTGILGTVETVENVGIDNFSITAKINQADTLKARTEGLDLEAMTDSVITRLEALPLVPPFTEEGSGQ